MRVKKKLYGNVKAHTLHSKKKMELENVWGASHHDTAEYVTTRDDYGNEIVERVQQIEPPTFLAQQAAPTSSDTHRLELLTGTQQRRGKAADSVANANVDPDVLPLLMDGQTAQQRRERVASFVETNRTGAQQVSESEAVHPRDDLYDGGNPKMDRRHFQNTRAQRPQLRGVDDRVNVGPADAPFKQPAQAGSVPDVRRTAPIEDAWRGQRSGPEAQAAFGVHQIGTDDTRARGVGAVQRGGGASAARAVPLMHRAQPIARGPADSRRGSAAAAAPLAQGQLVAVQKFGVPDQEGHAGRRQLAPAELAAGRRVLGSADSAHAPAARARRYGDALQAALSAVQSGHREAQLKAAAAVGALAPTELRPAHAARPVGAGRAVFAPLDAVAEHLFLAPAQRGERVRRGDATRREARTYANPASLAPVGAAASDAARGWSADAHAAPVGPRAAFDAAGGAPVVTAGVVSRPELFPRSGDERATTWTQVALSVCKDTYSRIFNDRREVVSRVGAAASHALQRAPDGVRPRAMRDDAVQRKPDALRSGADAGAVDVEVDHSAQRRTEWTAPQPRASLAVATDATPAAWTPRTTRGL